MASICCRRRFQTRCAVHLSAIAIFSVATTARRVEKKKHQNTAQPEVYMSLNRNLANRLLTAESTYFEVEKELPACSALWWLSALLRGNDSLSRAGGIFLWR